MGRAYLPVHENLDCPARRFQPTQLYRRLGAARRAVVSVEAGAGRVVGDNAMTDHRRGLAWWEVVGGLFGLMAAILIPDNIKFWFFFAVLAFVFLIRPGLSLLCWFLGLGTFRR